MESRGSSRGVRAAAQTVRTYPRRKRAALGTAALSIVGAAAIFVTPAFAVLSSVAPTFDVTTGLPDYYADSTGLQLTACDDGTAFCGAGAVTKSSFAADTVGANGLEDFVSLAVSTITGPVVTGQSAGVKLIQTLALEATHDPGGHVITFQRIRTRVQLGAPNASYSVIEPYGTQTIATNGSGTGTTTQDIGCPLGTNNPPCDFTRALGTGFAGATGSLGPFVKWDATAPAPPAGYIGDGVTAHTITGSPTGNNLFSITGPGLSNGNPGTSGTLTSTGYVVTGKISTVVPTAGVPGITASPSPLAFGSNSLLFGSAGVSKVVTVKSSGTAPLVIGAATIAGGSTPADFTITANTCSGTTKAPAATCTITVKFRTKAASGTFTSNLSIANNTGAPVTVAMSGTGSF